METYHKINAPFKRHMDGPDKGKLIMNDWALPELEYLANNQWEFTEKVDGTNIRVVHEMLSLLSGKRTGSRVRFAGRSDNASIPNPLLAYLEETFTPSRFINAGLENVTLYGEGYGPKIQGGGKYRDDHSFVLFDVKIGDFWLDRDNVNDVADKLNIDSVPVIGRGTLWQAISLVESGDHYLRISEDYVIKQNRGNGLNSAWGDFEAEGIVARPVVPLFNRKGDRIITKIKGKDFK